MKIPESKPENKTAEIPVPDWLKTQAGPLTKRVIETALEQATHPTVAQAERAIYTHLDAMTPEEIIEKKTSIPAQIVFELKAVARETNKKPDEFSTESTPEIRPFTETEAEKIARWREKAKSVLS